MTAIKLHTLRAAFANILGALTLAPSHSQAATAAEVNAAARKALGELYAGSDGAKALGEKAKGILVFPSITKGGSSFQGSTARAR